MGRLRDGLLALSVAVLLVGLVPPVGTLARRYVAVEALQFGLFAVAGPALVVLGAPWRRGSPGPVIGPARRKSDRRSAPGPIGRLALGRLHHRGPLRAVGYLAVYCAVVIAWRVPPAVDALARLPGLSLLEAATLVPAGALLWLELVSSPPLAPRSAHPARVALAAVAMWTTWIIGYVLGLSHVAWFPAYHHGPGAALSRAADQQLAAGILFCIPAMAFIPMIFASLMTWLKNSEDPDDELRKLLRSERRMSWGDPRGPGHVADGSGQDGAPGAGPPETGAPGG